VARPATLPDFASPPLVEVAISVQFDPLANYGQVWAGKIWDLFRDRFEIVHEQLPLQPAFETFGGPARPSIKVGFSQAPLHARLWFLNKDQTELLQFQNDRFARNWRKMPPFNNEYPRFETIIDKFEKDITSLERFCEEKGIGKLAPNQSELTYVNLISDEDELDKPDQLFKIFHFNEKFRPADLSCNLWYEIRDENNAPYGRLTVLVTREYVHDGRIGFRLEITARGAPAEQTIKACIERLTLFREKIVRTFDAITTETAHRRWKKIQ
jgi:uncharacterized protein (TIGR04255 family)